MTCGGTLSVAVKISTDNTMVSGEETYLDYDLQSSRYNVLILFFSYFVTEKKTRETGAFRLRSTSVRS